jgi:hypothetical protein
MLGLCLPAYKKRSMGSLGTNYVSRREAALARWRYVAVPATAFAQLGAALSLKSKRLANSAAPARAWPSGSADGRRAARVRFRARRCRDRESDGSATCAHQYLHRRTDEPHPPACPRQILLAFASWSGSVKEIGCTFDVEPLEMPEARFAQQVFGACGAQARAKARAAVGQ